jgi:signal transduction histidine kinase
LSNAIKYADPTRSPRWARISGRLTNGEVVVTVRDNGLGIPPAARERLFERFFRAHTETQAGVDGTGLGLSIVREAIRDLGGRIWAEFPEEGGAAFLFTIPARRASDG